MRCLPRARHACALLASLASWLMIACAAPQTVAPSPLTTTPTPAASPSPTSRIHIEPTLTLSTRPNNNILAGWVEHQESESGFAFALPAHWRRIDPARGAQLLGASAPADASGPQSPLPITPVHLFSGVCFVAVEAGDGAGVRPLASVNVLERRLDQAPSLAAFVKRNVGMLESSPQVRAPVEQTAVTLPAGPGVRLRYRLQATTGAGAEFELALTQYLLLRGRRGYVLTGAAPAASEGDYRPLFEAMAASLRWLR
ncbi:MAG: hypothetical protein ACUVX9_14895 [Anaerolineae bacterium]